MPSVVKTFTFVASIEGWSATTENNVVGNRNAGLACLQMYFPGGLFGPASANNHWELSTTWEEMGVSAGATVISVTGNYRWQVQAQESADAGTTGPFELRDGSGTLKGTFSTGLGFTGGSDWATRSGNAVAVPSEIQAAGSAIKLRLGVSLSMAEFSANLAARHDDIELVITTSSGNTYNVSISAGLSGGASLAGGKSFDSAADLAATLGGTFAAAKRLEGTFTGGISAGGTFGAEKAADAGLAIGIAPGSVFAGGVSVVAAIVAGLAKGAVMRGGKPYDASAALGVTSAAVVVGGKAIAVSTASFGIQGALNLVASLLFQAGITVRTEFRALEDGSIELQTSMGYLILSVDEKEGYLVLRGRD